MTIFVLATAEESAIISEQGNVPGRAPGGMPGKEGKAMKNTAFTRCLTLLLAAGTVLLSVAVAALASMIAAYRLSRVDPGTALREGN